MKNINWGHVVTIVILMLIVAAFIAIPNPRNYKYCIYQKSSYQETYHTDSYKIDSLGCIHFNSDYRNVIMCGTYNINEN